MISAILRLVVAVLLALFVLPLIFNLVLQVASERWQRWPEDPLPVAIGLVVGLALIFWRRPSGLLHTFLHELAHACACWLLFVRVHGFQVTRRKGGEVEHDACDPIRHTLILIAPYTVPMVLLPLAIAQECLAPGLARQILSGLVAWAFFSHLHGLWLNVSGNCLGTEADLYKVGRPLSFVAILGALALTFASTVWILWDSPLRQWWSQRTFLTSSVPASRDPAPSANQSPRRDSAPLELAPGWPPR